MNVNQKSYVDASMERVTDWAKQTGCDLPAILMTGIYTELNTMFSVGLDKGIDVEKEAKFDTEPEQVKREMDMMIFILNGCMGVLERQKNLDECAIKFLEKWKESKFRYKGSHCGGMEYTADLKSAAERIEGSTPSNGTKVKG